MKKYISVLLVFTLLAAALVSCGTFKDVKYKENGIMFTLPNTMRRAERADYDLYFTNTAVVFMGNKLDKEFCEKNAIDPNIEAKAYIDMLMEKNGLELDKTDYKYDDKLGSHNFRYSSGIEGEDSAVFYYTVVIGEPGNIWYIEMCCDETYYEDYIKTFGEWRRSISVYEE